MTKTNRPEKISAIIFDLDGTLLDTLEDIAQSMNTVLKRHGFPIHPIEDYRVFIGQGLSPLAEKAIQDGTRGNVSAEQMFKELLVEYKLSLNKTTDFYHGIPKLLDDISSQQIPMAVLSNKQDYLVKKLAEIFLTKWPFKNITGFLPNYPRKPDPALTLDIVNRMGVKPEECIFIGDSPADIHTAINAEMFPIGVLWGFRNKEILLEAGAEFLAHRPSEISDFISERILITH